ncbi:NADH dehydrogenase [ubiquinone] 1 alpha subcomplex assembly factor 3 [Mycena kentingensis (nom. inval.)]|nr:NADH dehydrogenase [ubiquinone] 1 alpha subcomplex assembly factor 3 [Mycena kentingensis (nom. inval.)]
MACFLRPLPRRVLARRPLSTSTPRYAGGLKNILASDAPPPTQIASVSPAGILLEDGLLLRGASIFLDGKVFLWDVPDSVTDWGREHLALFEVVAPRPEILLLGTGEELAHPPPSFRSRLVDLGIQVDIMSTRNACATYNLLTEEGRRVAAALAPLTPYRWPKTPIAPPK